jgi:hypothetical protein
MCHIDFVDLNERNISLIGNKMLVRKPQQQIQLGKIVLDIPGVESCNRFVIT